MINLEKQIKDFDKLLRSKGYETVMIIPAGLYTDDPITGRWPELALKELFMEADLQAFIPTEFKIRTYTQFDELSTAAITGIGEANIDWKEILLHCTYNEFRGFTAEKLRLSHGQLTGRYEEIPIESNERIPHINTTQSLLAQNTPQNLQREYRKQKFRNRLK
ncbi:MAG: hypothetical protein DI535_03530 [Citrobacter freundii]|nr:MAG: hypothetical protein DI535_03530 [Citrobacter freundii]